MDVTGGPPIPGAPWFRPLAQPLPGIAAAAPGASTPAPEAFAGPPIPGAPWLATRHPALGNFWAPLPPPPSPPPSHALPFLERVPDAPPRLRRFTELVSALVNSLLRSGQLVQTGPADFAIPLATGAGLTGTFDRGATGSTTTDGDHPMHFIVDSIVLPSETNAGALAVTSDYDTGAGTQTMTMFGWALPASGGAVPGGTATNPIRVDPTGTTPQPASQSGTWTVTGAGGTFPVTGTFWQATQPVSIAATVTVDTELPAAAALADTASNPTTVTVGADLSTWDGSNWNRFQGNTNGTALASAARTTTGISSNVTNYNCRGVIVYLNITVASGTGGLQVVVQGIDGAGNAYSLNVAPTAITATGNYIYVFYPGAASAPGSVGAAFQCVLPKTWRVAVLVGDASSYTYGVTYSMII